MDAKRTHIGRLTKTCETCGAPVTRAASRFKAHVFCSTGCYNGSAYSISRIIASNQRRYGDWSRESRPCLQCGTQVNRPVSQFNARTFCSRDCKRTYAIANPMRWLNSSGYVMVYAGKDYPGANRHGNVLEHRKVMQDHLGRPLADHENVHHRDGDKADNRLENLELWSRSQPHGQRVEDKIAWAREFLAFYNAN